MKKIILIILSLPFLLSANEDLFDVTKNKIIIKTSKPTQEQLDTESSCETVWSCPIVYWKTSTGKEYVTFNCKSVCEFSKNQTYSKKEFELLCEYD